MVHTLTVIINANFNFLLMFNSLTSAFLTLAWIVELVLTPLNLARLNAPYVLLTLSVLIQLVRTLLAILVPLAMDLYLVVPSAALKGSMYPYLSRQAVSYVQSIPMDHPKEAASIGKTLRQNDSSTMFLITFFFACV